MKYVFYDFETTGLSSAFDSIVQAAAISTDENFNIIDQFDLRGQMKKEYPVPHPKALICLLYTSPSPRDQRGSRMPSSA